MNNYIQATEYINYEHPVIQELVAAYRSMTVTDAIKIWYLKVRDGWRYNAFKIGVTHDHFKASNIAKNLEGHCIDKSILFIAGMRALGVPARLCLAKVSNHIAVERLINKIGTNELAPHGLVQIFHNAKWVKCAPIFNKELCAIYNVSPLEFDGSQDSMIQEYNSKNQKFMTYLEDYGHFEDVPVERIREIFKSNYPSLYDQFKNGGTI